MNPQETLARASDRLTSSDLGSSAGLPFVSVAIITLNNKPTIERCLESIDDLDYPRDKYEIVVLDGGSSDGTLDLLQKFRVKQVIDRRPCRGAARNTAVKNCGGELIAFTDADCMVDKRWLKSHVSIHRDPRIMVAAGSVLQGGDFGLPTTLYHSTYFATQSPATTRRNTWEIATCNASFKASSFKVAGPFQELDRGEESLLCWKIIQKGFQVVFDPSPKVVHLHRHMNFNALFKRSREEGYSDRLLQGAFGDRAPFRLPKSYALVAILTPSLAMARLARYFTKLVSGGYKKTRALLSIPVLIASSFYWLRGYLTASRQGGETILG